MARQITKQLAERIVQKLKAKKAPSRSKSPHELYDVEFNGIFVAQLSIRRGSNKEAGHDFIPGELYISPSKAKLLAQCPLSRDGYFELLKAKGLLESEGDDNKEGDDEQKSE